MKIPFLSFALFFLAGCATVPSQNLCPILNVARSYDLTFTYGRADINADAQKTLTEMASSAVRNREKICIAGMTDYDGAPDNLTALSLTRAQNVADLFVENGVKIKNIYLILSPNVAQTGVWRPDSSKNVRHVVHIDVGL